MENIPDYVVLLINGKFACELRKERQKVSKLLWFLPGQARLLLIFKKPAPRSARHYQKNDAPSMDGGPAGTAIGIMTGRSRISAQGP